MSLLAKRGGRLAILTTNDQSLGTVSNLRNGLLASLDYEISPQSASASQQSPGSESFGWPDGLGKKKFPPSRKNSMMGARWTVELGCLKDCGTVFEAAICLRRIRDVLEEINFADRIKFCRVDFETAVKQLKQQSFMYLDDLANDIRELNSDFFNQSVFHKLPIDIMKEIFVWLPIDDFAPIASVCGDWKEVACSDEVWQTFYRYKFLRHNPNTMPLEKGNFLKAFRSRLADPQLGDKVEVAWRGKFRLEALDVYQGLAWWVAEVVDKHTSQGKYKIHYPGWESKWDEWVPKARLRWAVDKNEIVHIQSDDIVELWCCGANVPGAWLESKVKKCRKGRYCVGRVLSTGSLWVERDRLRLVKHVINIQEDGVVPAMTGPRNSLTSGLPALSLTSSDNGRRDFLYRARSTMKPNCNMM